MKVRKGMSTKKTQSFTLDEEISDFIEEKKWDLRTDKSQIVNKVFKHFKNNEDQLKKIIKGESQNEQ